MPEAIIDLLDNILQHPTEPSHIFFAGGKSNPAPFSYQVNFSRVDLVCSGHYHNEIEDPRAGPTMIQLIPGDVLIIPPQCWNKPLWDTPCTLLSLLFSKTQIGASLIQYHPGHPSPFQVSKFSTGLGTQATLHHILAALDSLSAEAISGPMVSLLFQALVIQIRLILQAPPLAHPRRDHLFQQICRYIQEQCHHAMDRDSLAEHFNLSPSHISRTFSQYGASSLNSYIKQVRIDKAKSVLRQQRCHLQDVAAQCGFSDVNYFCRVFKQQTGMTPSAFRELCQSEAGAASGLWHVEPPSFLL